MKLIVLTLLLAGARAFGQAFSFADLADQAAATQVVGGTCTVATGDLFSETYQASGFVGTWTTNGVGTQNAGDTTFGSSCSGLGTYSYTVSTAAGASAWSRHDMGSGSTATKYFKFYFKVTSASIANGDDDFIFVWSNATDLSLFGLYGAGICLHQSGANLQVRSFCGISSAFGTATTIATGTRYRVEVKYVNANASGLTYRIYTADTGVQIGSDIVSSTAGAESNLRYVGLGIIGNNTGDTQNITFDGFGMDDTNYLGQ